MCYSSCFVHAAQRALVQRQLLQCRTCGSQAFHVLDCCRNPDYARVPTSPFSEKLKGWLGAVQARLQAALSRLHRRPAESTSPAALDAWEARSLILGNAESTPGLRESCAAKAAEEEQETVLSHR
jgi:hypothetical protein